MTRRLFTLVALLSLALCLATAVLWVRSYWTADRFGFSTLSAVWTDRGTLVTGHAEADPEMAPQGAFFPGYRHGELDDPEELFNPRRIARRGWNIGVAHVERFPPRNPFPASREFFVVVEFWAIVATAAALPAMWLLKISKRRMRVRGGRCAQCGYNLTGNTSGVCPECGTATTTGVKA
jgi:hypothetical protein